MNSFAFDASALAKRYGPETGSDRVDYLFSQLKRDRLLCLMLGVAEVVSVLVRRRNGGAISQAAFSQGMSNLKAEILDDDDFSTLPASNDLITSSLPLINKHSLNATDAIVLRVFLDLAALLRTGGNDLVCVASDQRLLKAAEAEGLMTFDPETQPLVELEALVSG
jgi:predicted nucleic acid-binding protein